MTFDGKDLNMKRFYKLLAIILVIAVIASFTAVSVSAAVTRRATCANCGGWDTVTGSKATVHKTVNVSGCSAINAAHRHVTYYDRDFYECRECGYIYEYNKSYPTYCK